MPYYAVPLPEPRVFDNWDDCQRHINGLSGAVYRKYETLAEAEAHAFRAVKTPEAGDMIAYTDGSRNTETDQCGSGIVFVKDDEIQEELSFSSPNTFGSNNVTAEANAVIRVLEYCVEKGIQRIFICHDLIHLAEYVRDHGCYEADKAATLDYQQRYRALVDKHQLKVYFNYVKGHSANRWNDRADQLARRACGLS